MNILITGGAGFIGLKLARKLLEQGAHVKILDSFSPQIHENSELPTDLKNEVELFHADIRDQRVLKQALTGVEKIVHLAAETGTGQSMYEIERYFSVNVQGTAGLIDLLQNDACGKNVSNIVLASSRAVYGEGAYKCKTHGKVFPEPRVREDLNKRQFDPHCPLCGVHVDLLPTDELAPFKPMSMYGLTKQVQEQTVLMYAKTRGINAFGLRYQNVYGPGQSLKNPYTGILAVFSNLARQNQNIEIYEDGLESRDFVYIDDVVEATVRSVNYDREFIGALNVGTGQATSVTEIAQEIINFFNSSSSVSVSGAFRMGDIRHNIADTTLLSHVLGFTPSINFKYGISEFLKWALSQPEQDKFAYDRSVSELMSKGLMGSGQS